MRPSFARLRELFSAPSENRLLPKRRPLRIEPLEGRWLLSIGTLHVDADSVAPAPDGLAWETAYPDLQDALDQAALLNTAGDGANDITAIWIAEGTYKPTAETDPADPRTATFSMLDSVSLYGGFFGDEPDLDSRHGGETILSGDLDASGDFSEGDAYHVVYADRVTDVAIDSLTITGGNADGNSSPHDRGGGMYNYSGTLTIDDVTLRRNRARNGGALANEAEGSLVDVCQASNGGVLEEGPETIRDDDWDTKAQEISVYGEGHDFAHKGDIQATITFPETSIEKIEYALGAATSVAVNGGARAWAYISLRIDGSWIVVAYHNWSTWQVYDVHESIDDGWTGVTGMRLKTDVQASDTGLVEAHHFEMAARKRSPTPTGATVAQSLFLDNAAAEEGGAVFSHNSTSSFINTVFAGNSAVNGGALANDHSALTITNATFYNNTATVAGGAIDAFDGSLTLNNAIVWGNVAPADPQIHVFSGVAPSITYSDIQGGLDIQGGWPGEGNIDADPQFVDPQNGDLHLLLGSPAIDAGNNSAVPTSVVTDLDGNPRFVDEPNTPDTGNGTPPVVDMGAYEFQGEPGEIHGTVFKDRDGDGIRDQHEPGMPWWTVYLDQNENGLWDSDEQSRQTRQRGEYSFEDLPAGTYIVAEVLRTGWQQTYPLWPGEVASDEFLVNSPDDDEQTVIASETSAMNADGRLVIVWQGLDTDRRGIYAQRFEADGTPLGNAIPVNSVTDGEQYGPAVAINDAGNFVVAWASEGMDSDGYAVVRRRFRWDGTSDGPELLVNNLVQEGNQHSPSVAMDGGGEFVITWESHAEGVYARQYDANGDPKGNEFRVSANPVQYEVTPSAAMSKQGKFLIVWGADPDGTGYHIRGQLFDAQGNENRLGSEIDVYSDGGPLDYAPSAAFDAAGNFVVVWMSEQDANDVLARRFDMNGQPLGDVVPVNTVTPLHQEHPDVAMADDGTFVVTWTSFGQDTDPPDPPDYGIFARRSNSSGEWEDEIEFQVNETPSGSQYLPSIAMDPDGNYVIVWHGNGPGDNEGVFARRYWESKVHTVHVDAGEVVSGIDFGNYDEHLHWDGLGPGNWSDPARWVDAAGNPSNDVPNSTTAAVVREDTVTVPGDIEVYSLTVESGQVRVDVGQTLTIAGELNVPDVSQAAMAGSEGLIAGDGSVVLGPGSMLSVAAGDFLGDFSQREWGDCTRSIITVAGGITGTFDVEPLAGEHLDYGVFHQGVNYVGNPGSVTAVNVDLFQAAPGDTDGNRLVEGPDIFNILEASLFGDGEVLNPDGTYAAVWGTGDFDGNHKVEGPDIFMMLEASLFGDGIYEGDLCALPGKSAPVETGWIAQFEAVRHGKPPRHSRPARAVDELMAMWGF